MRCPMRMAGEDPFKVCIEKDCAWWIEDDGCGVNALAYDISWLAANLFELLNAVKGVVADTEEDELTNPIDY